MTARDADMRATLRGGSTFEGNEYCVPIFSVELKLRFQLSGSERLQSSFGRQVFVEDPVDRFVQRHVDASFAARSCTLFAVRTPSATCFIPARTSCKVCPRRGRARPSGCATARPCR